MKGKDSKWTVKFRREKAGIETGRHQNVLHGVKERARI